MHDVMMTRIKDDFEAFCRRVGTYREKTTDPIEGKDAREAALDALYKLVQRIEK
jgi:hypothetical protein